MAKDVASSKTGNILVTIYLFIAGIITLNFLQNSIAVNVSGTVFLIASVYGVVAISKNKKYLF